MKIKTTFCRRLLLQIPPFFQPTLQIDTNFYTFAGQLPHSMLKHISSIWEFIGKKLGLPFCAAGSMIPQSGLSQNMPSQPEPAQASSYVTPSFGKVVRLDSFASKFIVPRNVDVWLPEGYTKDKKYPVLYMQDGQMLFDPKVAWNGQEWGVDEAITILSRDGKIRECIVVGVWNIYEHRRANYFPQKPWLSLPKADRDSIMKMKTWNGLLFFDNPVSSDSYLKFIVKELKPYIDKNFSTTGKREDTFIAGSSMGGLISWYAVCEYPKVFGGAACISTHWTGIHTNDKNPIPDAFVKYLRKKMPSPDVHKFYFDHGSLNLDALYAPTQQKVDAIMVAKRYPAALWQSQVFLGKDHNEKDWRARLHFPLGFLLKPAPPHPPTFNN